MVRRVCCCCCCYEQFLRREPQCVNLKIAFGLPTASVLSGHIVTILLALSLIQ